MAFKPGDLSIEDLAVIGGYLFLVIAVGLWSLCQSKRGTVSGYFLAGRYMTFFPVGMSLFASNIGSQHLVGLAGSGAAGGISVGAFEFNALVFLQIMGFVFLPVYIASGVVTLPEYIHKRFGGNRIRVLLALISLVVYIFTKISISMYSGALFMQQAAGWNLYASIFILLGLTGVCTVTGGLAAVMYLDTLMAFVMVGGSATTAYLGFQKVGGYSALRTKYMNAVATEVRMGNVTSGCGIPREDSFIMLRDPWKSDLPWLGFIIGQTCSSMWYWCADQVIVQRALAAKSLSHAQGGALLASWIKVLPLFIMVMPGMISRVLYTDAVACESAASCMKHCGSTTGCSNIAFPKLILEILPSGLRGLMLAVIMAALMSDLTSIFNSASTLFTMDIYRRVRSKAGTRELMIVGRVFIVVLCGIGILWVPIINEVEGGQLLLYHVSISNYLAPPITAVYLLAIFWKRTNEKGAFTAMICGFALGIARMVGNFIYKAPKCGEQDTRPDIIGKVHYMYFAFCLFLFSGLICVLVSLCTKPLDDEKIIRTTVWTKYDQTVRSDEMQEEVRAQHDEEVAQRVRLNSVLGPQEIELRSRSSVRDDDSVEMAAFPERLPCWKRALDLFCGLSNNMVEEKKTAEEQRKHLREVTSLKQGRITQGLLKVGLIFTLAMAVFLYVFWSVPDGGPTKPTIPIVGFN